MTRDKSYRCEAPSRRKLAIAEPDHMKSPEGTYGSGAVESTGGLHPENTGGIHGGGRSDEAEEEPRWDGREEEKEMRLTGESQLRKRAVSGSGVLRKSRSLSGSRLTAHGHIRLVTASLTQRRLCALFFPPRLL